MFILNDVKKEQVSLFSKMDNWSDYKKKLVLNGWPNFFRENILPEINEESYSVLYSDKASRPNTPVNYLVGLLIIQAMFNYSDAELIEEALFDEKIQYALGTLDYDNQPISKNMISNFRMKLYYYEKNNNELDPDGNYDLFGNTIKSLNSKLLNLKKIDKSLKRVDSMMISASCKKLTRMQLIYKINERIIKIANELNITLPNYLLNYLDENNSVDVLYKTKEEEIGGKLSMLLNHSIELRDLLKDNKEIVDSDEYKQLIRLINDQYDFDNSKPKDGKKIKPTSLQTPYDENATYRSKYGHNIGYVSNFVEVIDEDKNLNLIENWSVDKNVKSDNDFMNDIIKDKIESGNMQNETLIVDAAYFSSELNVKAQEAKIKLHPTDMTGKNDKETNLDEFIIDEENKVISCPNKQNPTSTKYNEHKDEIVAEFDRKKCENCPLKNDCPIKFYKNKTKLITSKKQFELSKVRKQRKTEEYKKISKKRAGVEGIPSVLRNYYRIDKRTSKGKFFLDVKLNGCMLSINIKRIVKYDTNNAYKNEKIEKLIKILNLYKISLIEVYRKL